MIDSVIGGDQPMIAQFLNCCRFAAASRVNARVERRYSNWYGHCMRPYATELTVERRCCGTVLGSLPSMAYPQ